MIDTLTVWTIGHSNRSLEALSSCCSCTASKPSPTCAASPVRGGCHSSAARRCGVHWVKRVSAMPGSRSFGGRRRPLADSPNLAWRNSSFRGYADHLQSDEFNRGLNRLLEMAGRQRTAMMCAEVLLWRCHRSLVSDVLKTRGIGGAAHPGREAALPTLSLPRHGWSTAS